MANSILRAVVKSVDKVSTWTGKAISWIMVILVLEVTYDVTMRYLFTAPTIWSYDVSYMLAGTIIMLVAPWVLMLDGHIALDVISNKFSARTRLILDIIFFIVCFFPLLSFLFKHSIDVTWIAVAHFEKSSITYWRPYIWPFRIMISFGFLMLLIQGVASFIRRLYLLAGREI